MSREERARRCIEQRIYRNAMGLPPEPKWRSIVPMLTEAGFATRVIRKRLKLATPLNTTDRLVLEQEILPQLTRNPELRDVLFVGCGNYTAHYQREFFGRVNYTTIEPDPQAARYGSRDCHWVAPLEELAHWCKPESFDLIICNGVYGWGLDTRQQLEAAFSQCHDSLRSGGLLLLGWDDVPRRRPVPLEQVDALADFERYPFARLGGWRYVTDTRFRHTYDFYQKKIPGNMSAEHAIDWNRPGSAETAGDPEATKTLDRNDRWWRAAFLSLLAVYLLLFAFNAVTRTRNFEDPDTMNFMDIARHISNGEGVRQATLGFNQPRFNVTDSIPTPLTHQPPLYPLTVAAVSKAVHLPVTDVALLISVACYGFVLLAGYGIARRLFGQREALATVLLLSLYEPLREFCQSAFSEPMGLLFLFAALWLLAVYAAQPARRWYLVSLAGLIAATAVATRYALAPLVAIGALFVFLQRSAWDKSYSAGLRHTTLFMIGPAVVALLLIQRNLKILSGALMPSYLPSTTGLLANARNSLASLVSDYADPVPDLVQFIVLLAVVGWLLFLAIRNGRLLPALRSILIGRSAQLLTAFSLAYVAFLIAERSHSFLDPIGARYLLPGAVVLVMLFAVFVVRAGGMNFRKLAIACCLVALGMVGFEARTTFATPNYRIQRVIDKSDRLKWIQQNTDSSDTIIGEDTVDVAFFFHRTAAVSYSPFPYTETMTYPKAIALCERFQPTHRRVLLILRNHAERDWDTWDYKLGPFIHNLSAGKGIEQYPQVTPVAELSDGKVFQLHCSTSDPIAPATSTR